MSKTRTSRLGAIVIAAALMSGTLNGRAPAQADVAPGPNVVFGTIETAAHQPVQGAIVTLELSPSAGYLDRAGGSLMHVLGTATTDAHGGYAVKVSAMDNVLREAEFLNGAVNLAVNVVKYEAMDGGYRTYLGAASVYGQIMSYGPSPLGWALAPLNIGAMTVADASLGIGGLPDTPSDDPQDPNRSEVATAPRPSSPLVGSVTSMLPWAPDPLPDLPYLGGGAVMYPPTLPEYPPAGTPESDPNENPDDRCKHTANQGTWLVDRLEGGYRWQPVGEVHATPTISVSYTYGQHGATVLGAAVSADGSHWKVSGGAAMTNDGGSDTALPKMPGTFSRRVNGEFTYVHNRKTWCPEGYNSENGPTAAHTFEIMALSWTGGLDYDSGDLPGDDYRSRDKAIDDLRAMTVRVRAHYAQVQGKSYKYTVDVSAFGVGLNAVSSFDESHKMEMWGGNETGIHAWGDVDVPSSPDNHAIYTY